MTRTITNKQTMLISSALVGMTLSTLAIRRYINKRRNRNVPPEQGASSNHQHQHHPPKLKSDFDKACTFAKKSKLSSSVSSNDQLMLYGLYKQATNGNYNDERNINSAKPSSKFNMVAQVKFEAWKKFQNMPQDFAMLKYIEVVHHFIDSNNNANNTNHKNNNTEGINNKSTAGGMGGIMDSFMSPNSSNDDIVYDDEDDDEDIDALLSEDDDDGHDHDHGDNIEQKKSKTHDLHFSFGNNKQSTLSNPAAEEAALSNGSLSSSSSSIPNHYNLHPLHAHTIDNNHSSLQTYILNYPSIDMNACDDNGQTALHLAADKGYHTIVQLLLQSGADVNAADISGISVLEAAVIGGKIDVVKLLLEAGADPDQEDMDGESPRSCAEDDEEEMQLLLRNAPVLEKDK